MVELYNKVCKECSKIVTKRYSTSFSLGIRLFSPELRTPIYAIYGFVRAADEIVDTFHEHDKKILLEEFRLETDKAIERGISMNPILHSFQDVVNQFGIDKELITAFLDSMEMDLDGRQYNTQLYEQYIYGSAEVVGLMCLKVFLNGDENEYKKLKPSAMALGSAFQKINFLRDVKDDYENKGRTYFPGVDLAQFTSEHKKAIETDIELDFKNGLEGILLLPKSARFGVYIAYKFYYSLFQKIRRSSHVAVLDSRIRIKNRYKAYLLAKYSLKNRLNLI